MHSRVATFPLKQGGDSLRGSSREFCAMYESMTQRCRINRLPNKRASGRGYTLGLSFYPERRIGCIGDMGLMG